MLTRGNLTSSTCHTQHVLHELWGHKFPKSLHLFCGHPNVGGMTSWMLSSKAKSRQNSYNNCIKYPPIDWLAMLKSESLQGQNRFKHIYAAHRFASSMHWYIKRRAATLKVLVVRLNAEGNTAKRYLPKSLIDNSYPISPSRSRHVNFSLGCWWTTKPSLKDK